MSSSFSVHVGYSSYSGWITSYPKTWWHKLAIYCAHGFCGSRVWTGHSRAPRYVSMQDGDWSHLNARPTHAWQLLRGGQLEADIAGVPRASLCICVFSIVFPVWWLQTSRASDMSAQAPKVHVPGESQAEAVLPFLTCAVTSTISFIRSKLVSLVHMQENGN